MSHRKGFENPTDHRQRNLLSRISTAERRRIHPLCRRSARGVTVGGRHGERGAHGSSRQDLARQASCQMDKNL